MKVTIKQWTTLYKITKLQWIWVQRKKLIIENSLMRNTWYLIYPIFACKKCLSFNLIILLYFLKSPNEKLILLVEKRFQLYIYNKKVNVFKDYFRVLLSVYNKHKRGATLVNISHDNYILAVFVVLLVVNVFTNDHFLNNNLN